MEVKRALVAVLLVLAACSSSSHHNTAPPTTAAPVDFRGQKAVDVNANQNLFTPATIIINPGTTVTWHNIDLEAHNVQKAVDGQDFGAPFGVKTPQFLPRDNYSFTFKKVGTYDYVCTIHNGMTGVVIVKVGKTSVPSSTAIG